MYYISCCLGKIRKSNKEAGSKSSSSSLTLFTNSNEKSKGKTEQNLTTDAEGYEKSIIEIGGLERKERKSEFLPLYIEEDGILKDTGKKIEVIT
ncbi:hypothetical protein SteCoe_15497 [Stentor coeruleus]|uniref:Uncharacterized protein n=1 Tax=Stentor coeruleus TaxID=5963 RepID=A0A1R2C3C5_9CILI|nr:hypothetical protein SteCoe_15497 [Stentor coeruleus]